MVEISFLSRFSPVTAHVLFSPLLPNAFGCVVFPSSIITVFFFSILFIDVWEISPLHQKKIVTKTEPQMNKFFVVCLFVFKCPL